MGRIPTLKRLITEDFKDQKSWIGKLLQPLNQFLETVNASLDHGLTFEDNIASEIKTLTFRNDTGVFPLKFLSKLGKKPKGLWVINAVDLEDAPSTLTTAVYADWGYNQDGQIQINNFSGLTSARNYAITLIVI